MSLSTAAWERVREGRPPDASEVAAVAREESSVLGEGRVVESTRELASRVLGAGPLDVWLRDPDVTDVALNGDGSVWVDRGHGMELVGTRLGPEEARILAVRLAGTAGRRLDDSCPWVDGQLPSGARLHAILPPLVAGGPHITIRVPARTHLTLEELSGLGMFPPGWVQVLDAIVRSRVAFVVSGAPARGRQRSWRPCSCASRQATGCSSSRTSASCMSTTPTSSGSRRGPPTSREPER